MFWMRLPLWEFSYAWIFCGILSDWYGFGWSLSCVEAADWAIWLLWLRAYSVCSLTVAGTKLEELKTFLLFLSTEPLSLFRICCELDFGLAFFCSLASSFPLKELSWTVGYNLYASFGFSYALPWLLLLRGCSKFVCDCVTLLRSERF